MYSKGGYPLRKSATRKAMLEVFISGVGSVSVNGLREPAGTASY
jgi:hypothetical protein